MFIMILMERKKSDIKLVLRGTSAWQSQKMRFLSPCISKFQNTKEERFSNYLRLSELNVHNDFTGAIESDINLSWEATVRGTHKKGVSCHLASSVLERHLACESWKSFRSLWIILVFCLNSGTILKLSSMAKVFVTLQLTLLYTMLVIWSSNNICDDRADNIQIWQKKGTGKNTKTDEFLEKLQKGEGGSFSIQKAMLQILGL